MHATSLLFKYTSPTAFIYSIIFLTDKIGSDWFQILYIEFATES